MAPNRFPPPKIAPGSSSLSPGKLARFQSSASTISDPSPEMSGEWQFVSTHKGRDDQNNKSESQSTTVATSWAPDILPSADEDRGESHFLLICGSQASGFPIQRH